jgi:HEAT repeat protein
VVANRRIEQHLEQIGALRTAPAAEAIPLLRKALADRSNLVVAKAAKVAAESLHRELIPDLLAAFDRLFADPVKRDTQCWGKQGIAKALREIEYGEAAPYLRGARYVQMEPVFGGYQDTAAGLRGVCLLALPGCADIRREEILRFLVDALTEADSAVRADAARAIGCMGGDDSALLLRLKARTGDSEAPVTGQVFESLLALERSHALDFVREFLSPAGGNVAEEAALAIGNSRMETGVEILLQACEGASDPDYRGVILRALSLSRQEQAVEFLRDRAKQGNRDARAALDLFPDSSATHG